MHNELRTYIFIYLLYKYKCNFKINVNMFINMHTSVNYKYLCIHILYISGYTLYVRTSNRYIYKCIYYICNMKRLRRLS